MSSSTSEAAILKLSGRETIRFVELYENEPVLWNSQHQNYNKKEAREQAAQRVATGLNIDNFTVKHVIMKFKNLRSSYLQEIKKIRESIESGCSSVDEYVPKVVWFPIMHRFLRSHCKPRQSRLNLNDSQIGDPQQKIDTHIDSPDGLETFKIEIPDDNLQSKVSNNIDQIHQTTSSVNTLSKKRKVSQTFSERTKLSRKERIIPAATNTQSSLINKTIQLDAFGKYVASMLGSLPTADSLALQQQIVDLLIDAQLCIQPQAQSPSRDTSAAISLYSDNSMESD